MLTSKQLESILTPYLPDTYSDWSYLVPSLQSYLDLLLKWNSRTNLTAIREPVEIVRRHFGESLFAAQHIGPTNSLIDLGSGAGFPGVPIQLLHPTLPILLAESQGKKAAFLQELIRTLKLPTTVWPNRAESLPMTRHFDTVTLRAVDDMPTALAEAARRTTRRILILTSARQVAQRSSQPPVSLPSSSEMFHVEHHPHKLKASDRRPLRTRPALPTLESHLPGFTFQTIPIPGTESGVLLLADRLPASDE